LATFVPGGFMKKVGIAIGVIILLLIVAVVIFAATFDVNRYRGTIQSEVQQRLGRQVTLGEMNLKIFPPRFRVENVAIADDPAFNKQKPFVQAQQLDVAVKLMPLLHKSVEVDSLTLARPSVELIKNAQGVWNFASIGQNPQQAQTPPAQPQPGAPAKQKQPSTPAQTQPAPSSTPQQPSSSEQQFSLGKLVIRDGQVALTDQQSKKPRSVYDHIDVTLTNFEPNHPFDIDAAAHLPGAGNQEVRLQGTGGPMVPGQPAATPFHGTLNLKQVAIAGLAKFLDSPALVNTDGILSGQTKISSDSGKMSANGSLNVQNAKIHGLDLGYPVALDYNVSNDVPQDLLTVHNATVKLGATPLVVSGTVNSKPTPAQIDLNLKGSNVSIAEAARLASAYGVAFAPGTTVTGTVNANVQARGAMDKPALNGTINGSNIQMTGKDVPQPVQVPAINLALTPTEVRSNNFNVTSAGTTINTQFNLRQYTSPNPVIDATLKAPNAQLPAVLAMAKAWGVTSLDKVNGAGTLNLDMHAVGPVKSLDQNALMRAVNGNLNLNFNNVRYSGADISHELGAIAGFLGKTGPTSKGVTDILKMTGNILVKSGVAQTNNLQAVLDIGTIAMSGTADLASQALNLTANAVLNKDFTQKVGGTNMGGYLQTALANNQGEMVIPVLITGTMQNPKFQPDMQKVAQMKLKGLLPSASNPAGGVSGILGGLLGQKGGQQAQPAKPGQPGQAAQPAQQNPTQDAVQQVIGLFGKKKQQQQQQPPPKK
jgi:AsmA-like protein